MYLGLFHECFQESLKLLTVIQSHTALEKPYSFTLIDVVASCCFLRSTIPSGVMIPIYVSTGWGYFFQQPFSRFSYRDNKYFRLFLRWFLLSGIAEPILDILFSSAYEILLSFIGIIYLYHLYTKEKASKFAILYNCKFTSFFQAL